MANFFYEAQALLEYRFIFNQDYVYIGKAALIHMPPAYRLDGAPPLYFLL